MAKKIVLKPHHKQMLMKHSILPERERQNSERTTNSKHPRSGETK
jgi:hypothetical protein